MNLRDLYDWAVEEAKKDNMTLIKEGVNEKGLSKVRSGLRQGVIDRCEIVFRNTKKNDECLNEIQNQLKIMSKVGLKIPTGKSNSENQQNTTQNANEK